MSEAAVDIAQQYLTFGLGSETFAINVERVREVLDTANVTQVPQTPDYMLGVINLRGSVVPVVDMRVKFGMETAEKTVDTCIVVLEIAVGGDIVVVGALADSVREVLDISADKIEPPPRLGTKLNTDFIQGMGNCNGEFVVILNVDQTFTCEELQLARMVGGSAETEVESEDTIVGFEA